MATTSYHYQQYELAVMVAALTHVISSTQPAAVAGATASGQQGTVILYTLLDLCMPQLPYSFFSPF